MATESIGATTAPDVEEVSPYEAAVERAHELSLVEHLLDLARADREWRQAVEAALRRKGTLGRLLTGGSKAADVWKSSLIRRRLLHELNNDAVALMAFARRHPALAHIDGADDCNADELLEEYGPFVAVLAAWCIDADEDTVKAPVVQAACDALESERAREVPAQETAEDTPVPYGEDAICKIRGLETRVEELTAALTETKQATDEQDKVIKHLRKDLRARRGEVSRKDRKATADAERIIELGDRLREADRQIAELREQRDEHARSLRKLEARSASDKSGIQTVEDKRFRETRELRDTIDGLQRRLAAAHELTEVLTARVASLEGKLLEERQQRKELEEAFSAFGMDDLLGDSHSFGQAVDALVRFRDSVSAYAMRQRERERAREAAEREAELEREAAAVARQAQEDADVAWRQLETDRITELETQLFSQDVDHVIIDGHNLTHRVYRPEDEERTRPWLEKVVVKMAQRLETQGREMRIHLVFDTPYNSNHLTLGHGVDLYFRNNVTDGGADAKIAELLDEGNPHARYMVVSTDRKHVWTDALEKMNSDGHEIDLVQVELLASYLQALDHHSR